MDNKKIKDTPFLPKTTFPLKNTNHLETEKKIRELWEEKQVYQKVLVKNQAGKPFILHSGPPYANGKIHLGHVLNFLIKDIIVRSRASEGYYTPFWLGWDTHGLPTELKALQVYKDQKTTNLRQFCHNFALEQLQLQKEQIKKLGLFTDYSKYYVTLDKNYEAEQIRIFGEMVKKDLIYQGFRPIYWSCSHETALAGAEIEYYPKKDTSLYFKIPLVSEFLGRQEVSLLVWTTQPWTIPANQLVAVKKIASYALVECEGEHLIILKKRVDLLNKWEKTAKIEKVFLGEELLGKHYFYPYRKDSEGYVVAGDEFIQETEGTGIVHLAPAFGAEDFNLAKKEKLTIECPLESNGVFNQKIGVPELIGKHYLEVNNYVISDLEKRNLVVRKEVISHNYPHDWRDKSPLVYRLTKQWFIKVGAIKKELLENIKKVEWYPNWTQEKMWQAINLREDWCISRQRKWGVPIPVLYKNNEPILDFEIIDYVAEIVASRGSDCWFDGNILPLLREKFPDLINEETILGQDIMDVWLDSGVSHWCVLGKNNDVNFFDKNDYSLIKTEKGIPDLLILLLNASWKKNKEWIWFVMFKIGSIKEETKIKLLDLYFLMRRRDFNYSEKILKERYSKDLEDWKKLERGLEKEWNNFINEKEGIYQFWVWEERNIRFHLIFSKFDTEENEKWKEWKAIGKASVAHGFYLLREIISCLVVNFGEEGKIEKISNNEEVKLKVEFDVNQEKVPDILITSEKNKEKVWMEVVEVYSCSVKIEGRKKQPLINYIQDKFDKAVKKSTGKNWEEKMKLIKHSLKDIKVAKLREEETDKGFFVSCIIPKEINNINHLMKELNESIKEKNDKWEKKGYKNFEKTALWTVLSATFPIVIKNWEGNTIVEQEIKKEFFTWFLIKRIQENLGDIEIKFGFLIITFLNFYYSDESNFLDEQDPLTKIKKEKFEGKRAYMISRTDFLKYYPSDIFLKATIPNLYIPIVNNKIKAADDIKRIEIIFKMRFGFDISSLKYEEMPVNFTLKVNKNFFYTE